MCENFTCFVSLGPSFNFTLFLNLTKPHKTITHWVSWVILKKRLQMCWHLVETFFFFFLIPLVQLKYSPDVSCKDIQWFCARMLPGFKQWTCGSLPAPAARKRPSPPSSNSVHMHVMWMQYYVKHFVQLFIRALQKKKKKKKQQKVPTFHPRDSVVLTFWWFGSACWQPGSPFTWRGPALFTDDDTAKCSHKWWEWEQK